MPIKYARSLSAPASVWAAWVPQDLNDQEYEILAWIPAEHATTRQARYHIHGVRQKDSPVVVEVNQSQFADTWASLGTFRFDLTRSHSGHVQLTNFTGEDNREVAFATVRWQPAGVAASAGERLADGFDPPVGTMSERRSNNIWPGEWYDVTGYDVLYTIRREPVGHNQWRDVKAFHTGADLNLPRNLDRRAPLFAVASGEVTFAGFMTAWGNIIVIRHDPLWPDAPPVYSRYAHMFSIDVRAGDRVERGERIGLIGEGDPDKPFAAHLHFDISPTTILEEKPSHWPALKREQVHQHYVDPRRFIEEHRPPQE
jgi:murein DD-endopeptidase MepM/ murein hydrolase activator NlpD